MFCKTMVAALMALALVSDARAAAPRLDPAAPPEVGVTVRGSWSHGEVHPADGDTLAATRGSWSGAGNSYSYQWQRCTEPGGSCADVPGATAATLKADSLFGSYLRVAVTATNADGSTTAHSALTARLADEYPNLIDWAIQPEVEGVPEEGRELSVAPEPYYAGSRPFTVQVSWQRCSGPGTGCSDVAPAVTGNTRYLLQPADVGRYLRAAYTIFNGAGHHNVGMTPAVGPVAANTQPPSSLSAPAISGEPVDGSLLQATAGSWSGARPMAFALQWLRCEGDACSEIVGETISQYRPGAADLGTRLRVRVTATNVNGESSSLSEPTAVVAPAPPMPAALPTVSGTLRDGQILAGARGGFTGTTPMTEADGWERCDGDGARCVVIPGSTAEAHTLTPADVGHRLRFRVTATNAAGSAIGRSAATGVIQAIAPAATTMPAVSGVARDEASLEGKVGTWTGTPEIAFARQWMRCSPAGCSPIAGAGGAGYELTAADVGSRIRLRVTASNFGNAVEALSPATEVVAASAPRAVEAPSVTGTARDGSVLTASAGSWKGTAPLAHATRWERCDGGCSQIDGAAGSSYRLTAADVGRRVRAVVVATGPGGTAEAASVATDPVAAVAPAVATGPELTGAARHGETLTASAAAWTGSTPIAVTRRWERCDPSCAPIADADGPALELSPDDVGSRIRVVERAANSAGGAEAASALTAVVTAVAPRADVAPAVTGAARDGETLESSRGTWSGTPELAFARRWLRCSSAGGLDGCELVPDSDGATYAVSGDDVGAYLRVRVAAANAAGSAAATSDAVGPVAAAAPSMAEGDGPRLTIPGDPDPATPDVGDRVVVENGRWAGTARDLGFVYRWERCDTSGCHAVAGRTGAAETVSAEDVGRQLRVVVTATNRAGSASQATPRLGVTRGAAAAPGPVPVPVLADVLPAGSLLAAGACQVVAGRRTLRAGGVTLTVRPGASSAAQPLPAVLTGVSGAKRITLRAGMHRVRLGKARRGRITAALRPAVLARGQLLQLAVVGRRGRPAKASGRLVVEPCQALLTVRLKGRRLSLRVDQRKPITRVDFTLPKGLAIRPATTRATGGELRIARRRLTLAAFPAGTRVATLTVRLAGRLRPGRALRFAAATDSTRLKATASVRW